MTGSSGDHLSSLLLGQNASTAVLANIATSSADTSAAAAAAAATAAAAAAAAHVQDSKDYGLLVIPWLPAHFELGSRRTAPIYWPGAQISGI